MPKHLSSYHPYSPNLEFHEDPEAEMYWLQLADFFDFPFIQHFDNLTHLEQLYRNANLLEISRNMKKSYHLKEEETLGTWCEVIPRVHQD